MARMQNKRAIELTLNFIVIIVIAITLFLFGIYFISFLSSEAIELNELTEDELDTAVANLICEGYDRVCVGIDRKEVMRKKVGIFGVKILNIIDDQSFDIVVARPTPSGYTRNSQPIESDSLKWSPRARSAFIQKNEEKNIGIGVEVPANAVSGTYIFDVSIMTQSGEKYSNVQKLYVDVP